jgi:hypothetical protein
MFELFNALFDVIQKNSIEITGHFYNVLAIEKVAGLLN